MKRTLTITLSLMLALIMQAQTTVTFMEIPVKGKQESFRQKLLKNGSYTDKNSVLKGVVDGTLSTITINVVNDEVESVTAIEDVKLTDERVAISRFNYLIDYYKENPDYTEYESNYYAEITCDTTAQRYINEDWYYAEFFQVAKNQRYTKRLSFKISNKYGGYRIVRHYDTNYDIDVKLPK